MSLPATGVIEIRATATANNVNGGGFNAARGGTDYTLQNAAQLTQADGTAASTTNFASVLGGFTSQMAGNYLHITASTGLTVGWYEIVAFVDTNNVTLDRSPGTGSATTFYVGGAMSLNSTLDDALFEIGIAGNIFYIKNGSYSLGQSVSISATGGNQSPIQIIGYNSTRGDNPMGSTRPVIACAANVFTMAASWRVSFCQFTGTGTTLVSLAARGDAYYCKFLHTGTSANLPALTTGGNPSTAFGCEMVSYRGRGANCNGHEFIRACYIHDSNIGIRHSNANILDVGGTIIESCVANAISVTTAINTLGIINGCTLFGSINKTGIGLQLVTGTQEIILTNSIITGFVTGVSHADSTQTIGYDDYNNYYNNTTDVTNWTKGPHDTALDPQFVSVSQITFMNGTTSGSVLTSSGADFSSVVDGQDMLYLVSGTGITAGVYGITAHTATTLTLDIAPGTDATANKVGQITIGHNFQIGANLGTSGYPGAFPAALTTGYAPIGAVVRNSSGSNGIRLVGAGGLV